MHRRWIAKLEHGATLDDADRAALATVASQTRRYVSGQEVIREGDVPDKVHLVLEGMACRYKLLADGSRQIMALLLPGDMCDIHVAILETMDHGIMSVTNSVIAEIARDQIEFLLANPRINRALWWATLVDEAVLREWLVNLGSRPADKRLAHLFCELLVRFRAVGLAQGDSYPLDLTQAELADLLGISAVHANRTMQALREHAGIEFRSGRVTIGDVDRLMALAEFTPNYLHLKPRETGASPGLPGRHLHEPQLRAS